jgi:hypothetical protein
MEGKRREKVGKEGKRRREEMKKEEEGRGQGRRDEVGRWRKLGKRGFKEKKGDILANSS